MRIRKKTFALRVSMILGLTHLTTTGWAGQIDPGLEAKMQSAGADELIQVVIRAIGTLPGSELKKQVTSQFATRAEQHRAAVEALQATSGAMQPAIMNALGSADFDGRVYNAKGFWIDNVITAEMTPSAISELSLRPDVDEILAMPEIELVDPIPADATDTFDPQVVQPNLKAIHADSVWAMGYTGSGRLLASLDTGVNGKHTALGPRWRGHNGYSLKESWFSPAYGDTVPTAYAGDGTNHGTQVMGIMVGWITTPNLRDTVGVCPDCQWISAAAIDIPCPTNLAPLCGNLFEALQWVADPDGDPLTDHDVPDAVANPWGAVTRGKDQFGNCVNTGIGCADIFWNAIDNVEAAGAVMVFAAGNEGNCGPGTIRNPANRITSETNAFSVGMVNTNSNIENPPIDPLSSRGPSVCNNQAIKPELVAPGVGIRTTMANGGFTSSTQLAYGTSFSTPHVAAAVALLRDYNPNATVDQIKLALLSSAKDLGPTGPDNQYGHGMLDVVAALRELPPNTQPNIVVQKDYYVRPGPGEQAHVALVLKNSGTSATNVNVTITSDDPRLTVQNGSAAFSDMPNVADTAANHNNPFNVTVALSDILSGERLPITVAITAAGGYSKTMHAAIQTGPERSDDFYTHDAGNFEMTVSSFGGFGLQQDNLNPRTKGDEVYGIGYLYGSDDTQSLFEGAFLVAIGPDQVSDAARDDAGSPDVDFFDDPGGRMTVLEPGDNFPEETRAGFSDAYAESPIGLFIEQRTWVSDAPAEDDYLICEYTLWNRSGETIDDVHAGLYFDWDFPFESFIIDGETTFVASHDDGGFDPDLGVGWMSDRLSPVRLRGLAVVSPLGTTSYHYFDNFDELYDGFTGSEKWEAMTEGFVQTEPPLEGDGSHLIATGPYSIEPNSAARVAFAIIGATEEENLLTSAQTAKNSYSSGIVSVSPVTLQFTAPVGGPDPEPNSVSIHNGTELSVTYSVVETPVYATVDPMSGEIPAGETANLMVEVAVGDRAAGIYRDTLLLTTSDPLLPVARVQVTLTVSGGAAGASVEPNPFNPRAAGSPTVTMNLKAAATPGTTANIYDLSGSSVIGLGTLASGAMSLTWDGRNEDKNHVSDGVYLCYVEAPGSGGFEQVFKIVVKKK